MKKVLILILLLISATIFGEEKWNTEVDQPRYKVFTRRAAGQNTDDVKVIAYMTGTIKEAKSIIMDIKNYPKFMSYVNNTTVLKSDDKCVDAHYVISKSIMSDRDYVARLCSRRINDKRTKLSWNIIKSSIKPNKNAVRVTVNEGYWTIDQIRKDELRIEYFIRFDPAGSLPSYFVNKAQKNGTPQFVWSVYNEILKRRK